MKFQRNLHDNNSKGLYPIATQEYWTKKNSAIRHLGKSLLQIKAWGTKSISVHRHAYCTSEMSNPLPWKEDA
jgi:hypothetical protein